MFHVTKLMSSFHISLVISLCFIPYIFHPKTSVERVSNINFSVCFFFFPSIVTTYYLSQKRNITKSKCIISVIYKMLYIFIYSYIFNNKITENLKLQAFYKSTKRNVKITPCFFRIIFLFAFTCCNSQYVQVCVFAKESKFSSAWSEKLYLFFVC